jgi:hypothetical protein
MARPLFDNHDIHACAYCQSRWTYCGDTHGRPILDLKVAMVARDVARLYATFCDFPRICFATLRNFIKIIANDRKTSIDKASFFFVPRPIATFRDLSRLCATCVRDFDRDYAKVRSMIGLLSFGECPLFFRASSTVAFAWSGLAAQSRRHGGSWGRWNGLPIMIAEPADVERLCQRF